MISRTAQSWPDGVAIELPIVTEKKPMTASQINKEMDKLSALDSKLTDEFIAAGRGHERAFDIMKQTDTLSMRYRAIVERKWDLLNELERRWGPGMHKAPVGRSRSIGRRVN
jgi:hypothetical protein